METSNFSGQFKPGDPEYIDKDTRFTADGSAYGYPGPLYIQEPIQYRVITTFNAQITKWGFCALGFVIGWMLALIVRGA